MMETYSDGDIENEREERTYPWEDEAIEVVRELLLDETAGKGPYEAPEETDEEWNARTDKVLADAAEKWDIPRRGGDDE